MNHKNRITYNNLVSALVLTVGLGLVFDAPANAEGVDQIIQKIVEKGDLKMSLDSQNHLFALSSNATNPKRESKIQEELEQDIIKCLPSVTPWVQQVLLRQLTLMGSDKCVSAIKICLKSEDTQLRNEARQTLQHLGSDMALMALLEEMPKVKDEIELQGYVQSLGKFQNEFVAPVLGAIVNHKNGLIARAAINALGQIHSPESFSILLKSKMAVRKELKNDLDLALMNHTSISASEAKNIFLNNNGVAKVMALQFLCKNIQVDMSLIKVVLGEKNPQIKPALLKVCAQDPNVCDFLIKEESQFVGMDVISVFSGLSESRNKSKEDWVLKYVSSEDEIIQVAAIRAIPSIASSKSLTPLVSQLSHKNEKVKDATRNALKVLHGHEFAPLLIKSYEEGNLEQKNLILQVISYCVIPNGNDLCLKMMESQEPFSNKSVALQTLCTIGGMDELKKLINWLNQSEDENEIQVFSSAVKKIYSKFKGDIELAVFFDQTIKSAKSEEKKALFAGIIAVKDVNK